MSRSIDPEPCELRICYNLRIPCRGIDGMAKKSTNPDKKTTMDFDTSLEQLQGLVDRMENSELTLELSLQEFERGIKLTRYVQQTLSNAEQRVQLLLEKDDVPTFEEFEENIQK